MKDGFLVFDCHTYMGKLNVADGIDLPEVCDAHAMVALMDQAGVDKVLAMASGASGPEYVEGNDLIAKGMKAYPGRIYGLARINPHKGERSTEDLKYWIRERGLCGLKLSATADGFVVNDKDLLGPIMETAEELGVPVMMHSELSIRCTPALIADLAMDFPGVNIIVAHMGMYEGHVEAITFGRRVKNLFLETSFIPRPTIVRKAVMTIGAEKLLYGSDAPYFDFEFALDKIAKYARLSDEEARLVLGGNIARLLGVES